jgi:hypothetical protein
MSSQATQSQVGPHRRERAAAAVDDTLVDQRLVDYRPLDFTPLDFRLVDVGLLVAFIATVVFFAAQLF